MREIKWRAWDSANKKMWFPYAVGNGYALKHDGLCWRSDSIGDPVMQYTGLKDKNGVPIFEGDIVEWPSINKVTMRKEKSRMAVEWKSALDFKPFINPDSEIIGNLYENPELLNKEST